MEEVGGLRLYGGQRSRGVRVRSQAEVFQLLSALPVDSRQGAVLLRKTPELLLETGDLNGNVLVLHQLCQQLPSEWARQKVGLFEMTGTTHGEEGSN